MPGSEPSRSKDQCAPEWDVLNVPDGGFDSGRAARSMRETFVVPKRDETSIAVVEAARQLSAKWARRGKDADLIVIANPVNRLLWHRWRIVEGLDLRVGCRRNPPPEGLTLGGHQALLFPVRERQPFSDNWTNVEALDAVIAKIERQLTKWTAT